MTPRVFHRSLACLLLLSAVAGCDKSPAAEPVDPRVRILPTVDVVVAGRKFVLEVANTPADRQQGLMFRKSMPIDHGMLFVFPQPVANGFWMKETYIPLDIAYINSDGQVIATLTMTPHDLSNRRPGGFYSYAIEFNAGVVEKIGLKPGDRIDIPPSLTAMD